MLSSLLGLPTAIRLAGVLLLAAAAIALIGLIVSQTPPDRARAAAVIDSSLAPIPEAIFGDGGGLYPGIVQPKARITQRFELPSTQEAVVDGLGLPPKQAAQTLDMLTTSLRVQIVEDGRIGFEFVAPSEEIGRGIVEGYLEIERAIQEPIAERREAAARARLEVLEEHLAFLDRLLVQVDVTPGVELDSTGELTQAQRLVLSLLATEGATDLAEQVLEVRKDTENMALSLRSMLMGSRHIAISELSVLEAEPGLQRALFFTIAMGLALIALAVLSVWFVFGDHRGSARHGSGAGDPPTATV